MGDTTQRRKSDVIFTVAENLSAENARLSRQLELEVAARKLAEAARKEFFDDNKRLSRQLEEARKEYESINGEAQTYSLTHHNEKAFALNQQLLGALRIMRAIEQAERVLADKEGTKK
jgi:hypothetical protein